MNIRVTFGFLVLCNLAWAEAIFSQPASGQDNVPRSEDHLNSKETLKYDKSDEMLEKMRLAIEDIAGSYGDPPFLQIFTNEPDEAETMRIKLKEFAGGNEMRTELVALKKERSDLQADLALKAKETKKLEDKIQRQIKQLNEIASAIARAQSLLDASTNQAIVN